MKQQQEHCHHHHHAELPASENMGKRYLLGIILNAAFVMVEFGAGLWYGSMGLLADAGHNLGDVGSLLIAMIAFWLARKSRTENFTYGFRKATIHASLINAVILLVAVGAIVVECVRKLLNPEEVGGLPIIITAGAGIIVNGLTVLLFRRDGERDLNVRGAYLHMLADTLVSIGVVISGIVIWCTGWTVCDPIIGLVIAAVILASGWGLMKESLRLSLDGIPAGIDLEEIRREVLENGNVAGIHHLHIWPISTTENAMTAHVVLRDLTELENTKQAIRAELLEHGIGHSTLEFETIGTQCPQAQW